MPMFFAHASETQKRDIITSITAFLNDPIELLREATIRALGTFFAHASQNLKEQILPDIVSKLNHTQSFECLEIINVLATIFEHCLDNQKHQILTHLIAKLNGDTNSLIYENVFAFLTTKSHCLSKQQTKDLSAILLIQLNTSETEKAYTKISTLLMKLVSNSALSTEGGLAQSIVDELQQKTTTPSRFATIFCTVQAPLLWSSIHLNKEKMTTSKASAASSAFTERRELGLRAAFGRRG